VGDSHTGPTDADLQRFVNESYRLGSSKKAIVTFGRKPGTAKDWVAMARNKNIVPDLSAAAVVPDETVERNLRRQVVELRRQLDSVQREEDTAALIRERVYGLAAITPQPPAWLTQESKASKVRGCPVTIWSDWHYGEVVRKEEVGGVNEFNAKIAAQRIQRLVDSTIELCFHHMGASEAEYPGIVVALGGDMISGDIHEELAHTNDKTPYQAINELVDLIAAALTQMADKFGKVFVPCVVGNHGRGTHKPRHKGRIFTSFEWNLYCTLERHFRNDKRISFDIPEQTDCLFSVYGHRILLTHGDSLGARGGDGIIGSIGPIMRGKIKTGHSEAQIGRDFDTLMIGHYHQYITLPGLVVNNCLKGYDEYARLFLRAPYSRPSQALFFVHPKHGVTAHWQVYLEDQARGAHDSAWLKVLK
jgi:transposase-like protein